MSISNKHSISKSSISNVTFDIQGPTLDIGVTRIQMKFPANLKSAGSSVKLKPSLKIRKSKTLIMIDIIITIEANSGSEIV